ncbi:MAG: hypothetical protein QOE40_936 [Actinomycetota bacterium]|jgi:hypothetical protein|nr:hypothetical protein [Actinomycetota bacterium]
MGADQDVDRSEDGTDDKSQVIRCHWRHSFSSTRTPSWRRRRVAAIEPTTVRVLRLAEVDPQRVLDEGEGETSVAEWRAGHERFWHSPEVRAEPGDASFTVNDDTLVLAQRFRLVHTAHDL